MNTKSKAVNCPRQGCKNKAIIDTTYGVLPCQTHQNEDAAYVMPNLPEFYSMTKVQRVQEQRDKYNKDTLQPYLPGKDQRPDPDFVKAYPDKARNYFSEEQLKKM